MTEFPAAMEALKDDMAQAYYADQGQTILRMMRVECPVDTGVLQQQHGIEPPRKIPGGFLIRFHALPYWGVFVSEGHGVIVPVRAKVLRFTTKHGKVVFTKRVRAVAPNPWMYRTFVRAGLQEAKRVFR